MTEAPLELRGRNPDVLSCIANLSNDEVFTPPELANRMLDTLADAWAEANNRESMWSNSSITFLDPCTKTGVFLREIVKRLTEGLADAIPDLPARVDHILTKQVFGLAITELTSLLARRTLYCSKWANGEHSVAKSFDSSEGNIWFERTEHSWAGDSCRWCGAGKSNLGRGNGLESYAYGFIHTDDVGRWMDGLFGDDVQFDVIIGNPPYQIDDEGGHRPVPLYHRFVQQAKALDPRYLVMVTPSRWMAGGLGLGAYRAEMLADPRIRSLVDYPVSKEVFSGVEIKGGVSYFLWSRDNPGPCAFTSVRDNQPVGPLERRLDQHDILVRDPKGLELLDRVLSMGEPSFESLVASVRPFGDRLRSNFSDYRRRADGDYTVPILVNEGGRRVEAWTKPSYVTANAELASAWKVFLPKAGSDGGQRLPNPVIGRPRLGRPGQVSTETYLAIGPFASEDQARNALTYLATRVARYLISLRKISQDTIPNTFRWLPVQDWSEPTSDDTLVLRYKITADELAHIRAVVSEPADADG